MTNSHDHATTSTMMLKRLEVAGLSIKQEVQRGKGAKGDKDFTLSLSRSNDLSLGRRSVVGQFG